MNVASRRLVDRIRAAAASVLAAALALAGPVGAQDADEPELLTSEELEELVAPIALYPDDLVAIVLPAATYPLDIVEAARFLDDLENGPNLAPDDDWDDSIVALLNYPEVLRRMDEDLDWTWQLGEAFLNQRADVFDAIQRFRARAREAGNLVTDERIVVREDDGAVRIASADPEVIYVPYYEPREVIVHHHHHYTPIRYYPKPYPVYYYPYPPGYSFWSGYFWGVTTAFVIGWHTHHLHVHLPVHVHHPYHRHHYHEPFYVRRSISINIVNIDRDVYVWQPRHHRVGVRPGRVTVTREGHVRADYGSRRYVARGTGGGHTVSVAERPAAASSGRTIGGVATTEPRAARAADGARASLRSASERSATAAGSTRSVTGLGPESSSGRTRDGSTVGGRGTTRERAVNGPRDVGGRSAASNAPSSNRTIGGVARSTGSAGPRGTTSANRSAAAPTRSNTNPTRVTASTPRIATGESRRMTSPSRDVASSNRSATRSTIGGVSPSRSAAPRSASGATRSAAAAPSRGSAAAGTARAPSRSAGAARSSAARSSGGARASTGRTRTNF